ncbi:MAG: hypothetical protein ABIJ00_12075 [Candidatus Eisenbacteria bacterium]
MSKVIEVLALTAVCVTLLAIPALASPDLWGTSSAWEATEPEYEGYWKYCLTVNWIDLPHGVSHVDLLVMLESCACACTPGYFAFADTVGSGPGTNSVPCTVYYYGLFECHGDPSIGITDPLVKFEPYENCCEPDKDGYATVCFYSVASPTEAGLYEDVIVLKYSTEYATGDLDGVLPICDPAYSATEPTAWGQIKALYR